MENIRTQLLDIEIKTIRLTDNIYMLRGKGGNIGVSAGKDGILMIDSGYKEFSEKIARAIGDLGSPCPRFLFNTHWHADHTEGNNYFGKDTLIISHINARKSLLKDTFVRGKKSLAYPPHGLPSITFEESISIHFNGEEVKAKYHPNAHTDGDCVVDFPKSNVVHLGDLYFHDRFPFIDLENGGSVRGMIKHLDDIIAQLPADIKIIPGHGPLAALDELKNYLEMIKETFAIIKEGIRKGKTLEHLQEEGLPEKYDDWPTDFISRDFWIETLYRGLGD
jgi:cyclase